MINKELLNLTQDYVNDLSRLLNYDEDSEHVIYSKASEFAFVHSIADRLDDLTLKIEDIGYYVAEIKENLEK